MVLPPSYYSEDKIYSVKTWERGHKIKRKVKDNIGGYHGRFNH